MTKIKQGPSFSHPEVTPWDAYVAEFERWFSVNTPWYMRLFKKRMRAVWGQALLVNAQKGGKYD
ncbi:MAG: hypothetical protein J7K40_00780 [candidate division Zixibacteria bacterium]|nr:hypothetical protein [candidate division Zixibacteria bacterium]